ncbi:low-density lipoprotein receptor-related protein 8-like [Scylla paramamosain]|uniref:low-density lipoprotein receptor-related protein 8-like n=1 Tax=Scylla paramamosain TaxID=85552 RepID=UPI00308337DA
MPLLDEMVLQCGIDECREKNGGCGHLCVSTVELNYYCQCQPGYRLIKKFNCEGEDLSVTLQSVFSNILALHLYI